MTNPPDAPSDDGGAPPVPPPPHDSAMNATPSRQKATGPKGPVLIEKTVKFRFTRANQHDAIDPATIHLHWVHLVQEALEKEIQVFTNNGGIMPQVDTMRWTSVQHAQQYKIHSQQPKADGYNRDHSSHQPTSRSPTAFIMHRIRTTATITAIRNLPRVQKLLRDNGVFMTEHRWSEDVWNISQQGFMLGIDPQFYTPLQAHQRISSALEKALKKSTTPIRIPKFAVAFCTPQVNIGSTSVKTKAYAIETEKSKAIEMQRALKEACKQTNDFVPFHLRSKHPEAFSRYVQQQSKILSQNHTIVLNYLGNQTILYLEDRIKAISGVLDLVPSQKVESDGKFRVLVKKENFYKVRSEISKKLPKWYEEHVPEDAKRMKIFPSPPEVAPLAPDGYDSGSDGYMTASINTAMSYASVASQLTSESVFDGQSQSHEPNERMSSTHQNRTFHTPPPTSINATPETDAGLVSELHSSKSEVEALKTQMAQMVKDKQAQIQELEKRAQQEKSENEARAAEQTKQMEAQAEAQRREFQQKLEEQRLEFDRLNTQLQREMEEKIQHQISQAIQDHISSPANQSPPTPDPVDVVQRMESQDEQIRKLTNMVQQLVTRTTPPITTTVYRPSTGKRQAPRPIEHTIDHQDLEETSQSSHRTRPDPGGKKRDTKETPRQQPLASSLSIAFNRAHSPAPSDLSMSMADHPASQINEGNAWHGLHPPSEVYSPPVRQRLYRSSSDDPSIISDLAAHSRFQSPGDKFLSDSSFQAADHYRDAATSQSFDNSKQFSKAQRQDIYAQHAGLQGFHIHSGKADVSQEEEQQGSAQSPREGYTEANQATPVDGFNPNVNHE